MDIYGHPITLSYKGETTHKTLLGGIFTLIAILLIVSYFIYNLFSVIHNTPSVNHSYFYWDLTVDESIVSVNST
jgi:hypothetical protein